MNCKSSHIFVDIIPDVPDGEAPKIIVSPDPVGRYRGGEDDAVDGDYGGLIHWNGEDVGQVDHEASTNRGEKGGD